MWKWNNNNNNNNNNNSNNNNNNNNNNNSNNSNINKTEKKNNCFALDTTSLNFGALIRKKRKRFKFLNPPERLKIVLYFSVNGKFLLIALPITTFVALTMLACCCYCCCCKDSGCGECLRHICCCCCCDENPSSFSGTVTYSIPSCKSLIKPEWQVRPNIYSINRLREINYPLKCVYYWESRYCVIVFSR